MFGIDPRIIAVVCVAFIALGIFNILRGRKDLLQMQARGQRLAWHEQMGILTGIEYILLACAFLLSLSITYRWLPASLNVIIGPLYLLALLAAAILAAFVLYRNFTLSRRNRAIQQAQKTVAPAAEEEGDHQHHHNSGLTPEERARKRRERRRKAAEARRRRAGKA